MTAHTLTEIAQELSEESLAAEYLSQQRHAKLFFTCMKAAITMAFITVSVAAVVAWQGVKPPRVQTYLSDGELFTQRIEPIVNRHVTTEEARQWVKRAVADLMSLHFRSLREDLAAREKYFLDDGYKRYLDSMVDRGVVSRVGSEGLIITAVNRSKPIMERGVLSGGYASWLFTFEVIQTIQGAATNKVTRVSEVKVLVREVDRSVRREGLYIVSFDLVRS